MVTFDVAHAMLREVWHNACFMTTRRNAPTIRSNESSRSSCPTQAYKQFSTFAQRSHALIRPHVNYSSSALGSVARFVEAKRRARVFERHELNVKFVDHLDQLLHVSASGDVTDSSTTLMTLTSFRRKASKSPES